jgi:hypothetical protein
MEGARTSEWSKVREMEEKKEALLPRGCVAKNKREGNFLELRIER